MIKSELLNRFYNNSIQIHISVINDIIDECFNKNLKILVFGLGYDSLLWHNITNNNTWFVEDNQTYIDLNKDIPQSNIIKYNYKNINKKSITVEDSFNISDEIIHSYKIPEKLLQLAPFDIIIIDGPAGYSGNRPGRLLPIYWSKYYLTKSGSIIYIDDSNRKLEKHCINKYLINNKIKHFPDRAGCDKILI